MYSEPLCLRCPPFEEGAEAQFYFRTPELDEVLAILDDATHRQQGTVLVLGEAGAGKSQMLKAFMARLQPSDQCVKIICATAARTHLLRETCKSFNVALKPREDHSHRLDRLRRHLTRTRDVGKHCLLAIDQAENLAAANLSELSALCDLQDHRGKLLTILMFAQPRFRLLLRDSPYAGLQQRVLAERLVSALSLPQTGEYIAHRLFAAGAEVPDLFGAEAVAQVYNSTLGVPRLINRICDAALRAAGKAGLTRIDAATVRSVTKPGQVPALPAVVQPVVESQTSRSAIEIALVPEPESSATGPTASSAEPAALWARPMESLIAAGQTLLDGLEGALARVERMGTSYDAAFDRYRSIEVNVERLLEGAARLADRLSRLTEDAGESCETLERKLQNKVADSHRQFDDLTHHLRESLRETERRAEVLDRSTERAQRAELSTTKTTEQLGQAIEKADSQHRRLKEALDQGNALSNLLIRGEDLVRNLRDMSSTVEGIRDRAVSEVRSAGLEAATVRDQVVGIVGDAKAICQEVVEAGEKGRQLEAVGRRLEGRQAEVVALTDRLQENVEAARRMQATTLSELSITGDRAAQLVQQLRDAVNQAENSGGRFQRLVHEAVRTVQETGQQAMEAVSKHGAQTADQMGSAAEIVDRLNEGLDALRKERGTALAEVSAADRRAAQTLLQLREAGAQVEEIGNRVKREIQDAANSAQEASQRTVEAASQRGAQSARELVEAAVVADELRGRLSLAAAEARAICDKALETVELNREARETARRLADRQAEAQAILERLPETAERVRKQSDEALADVASAVAVAAQTAQELRQSSANVEESGASTLRGLREDVTRAEEVGRRLAEALTQRGHEVAKEQEEALAQAALVRQRMLQEFATAAETAQLAQERAKDVLEEASAAAERVLAVCEAVTRREDQARSTTNDLAQRQEEAKATMEGLSGAARAAATGRDELRDAVTLAKVGMGQLEACRSESVEVLAKLSTAQAAVSTVLEESNDAVAAVQGTLQELQREADVAIESVRGQCELAREAADRLGLGRSEIVEVLVQAENVTRNAEASKTAIEVAIALAAEQRSLLESRTASAKEALPHLGEAQSRIDASLAQAAERIEQVAELSSQMDTAKETADSLRATADEARILHDAIKGIGMTATEQGNRLSELNHSASAVLEQQEHLRQAAEVAYLRATEQLAAHQAWTQTAENLLTEFVHRAERLGDRLHELQGMVQGVEQRISEIGEGPGRILAEAQAETTRLSGVCSAVRKVFAHLAQTTLEARKQTVEFERSGREAQEKLARLNSETQAAAGTLQEWVNEAVRAQARLERTVRQCPPIEVTHSAEPLKRMSRPLTAVAVLPGQDPNDAKTMQGFEVPGGVSLHSDRTPKPVPPTDDIAQMIEDAKRTHTIDLP